MVPQVTGKTYHLDPSLLDQALDPQNFVDVRRIPGGPAPDVLEQAIAASRERLVADLAWLENASRSIEQAEQKLKTQTEAFLLKFQGT